MSYSSDKPKTKINCQLCDYKLLRPRCMVTYFIFFKFSRMIFHVKHTYCVYQHEPRRLKTFHYCKITQITKITFNLLKDFGSFLKKISPTQVQYKKNLIKSDLSSITCAWSYLTSWSLVLPAFCKSP